MADIIQFRPRKADEKPEEPPVGMDKPEYGDWGFLQCPCCASEHCGFAAVMIEDAAGALLAALLCVDCESTLIVEGGRISKINENLEPPVIDDPGFDEDIVRMAVEVGRGMASKHKSVVLDPDEWAEIDKALASILGETAN